MDKIEQFIVEQNVEHFFQQIDGEPDRARQSVLSDVLLQEANRFCRLAGTLDQLEIYIARCDTYVAKYRPLLEGGDVSDREHLRKFVENMIELGQTLRSTHALQKDALDQLNRP